MKFGMNGSLLHSPSQFLTHLHLSAIRTLFTLALLLVFLPLNARTP